MRWKILETFESCVNALPQPFESIALVGGQINEPELSVVSYIQVLYYGIQGDERMNMTHFDLNIPQVVDTQHDLVLCSQVLEHVYDVKQSIENLAKLVRKGGYLWIACPTSNYAHGSPEYFSAGYTPELITKLLMPLGFNIELSEKFGSERLYFFTHTLRYWPPKSEYYNPLKFKLSRYSLRDLFWRTVALTKSSIFDSELHHATETVVFAKKN